MTQTGWLEKPQEWRSIPGGEPEEPRRRYPLKAQLDEIVRSGAAGRPFLLRKVPAGNTDKLRNSAKGYRHQYGKVGFRFAVRKLPSEDMVGLWTVWQPPDARLLA